jgi:hypothetical protein
MKKLSVWIAILIVIVVGVRVNAQKIFSEQMFEYDTSIYLNIPGDKYIEWCFDNDSCFVYWTDTMLYTLNIYNNNITQTSIKDYIKWAACLAANKDYIVIMTNDNIWDTIEDAYIFKRQNGKCYYQKTIHIDNVYTADEVYLSRDNKLLLSDSYLTGSNTNYDNPFTLLLLDIVTGKEIKRIPLPFELPMLSYFGPTKVVGITDNSIFFSQKRINKIYEYDYNLDLKDSLVNNNIKWKSYPKDKHDTILKSYSEVADRAGTMVEDVYKHSMVFTLYPFDNKVLVSYNDRYYKGKRDYFEASFDVWERKDDGWQLKINNAHDAMLEKHQKKGQYKRMGDITKEECFCKDGKIYVLRKGIPLSLNKILSMSKKEYKKLQKEYYSAHSDELFFDVYKIKF